MLHTVLFCRKPCDVLASRKHKHQDCWLGHTGVVEPIIKPAVTSRRLPQSEFLSAPLPRGWLCSKLGPEAKEGSATGLACVAHFAMKVSASNCDSCCERSLASDLRAPQSKLVKARCLAFLLRLSKPSGSSMARPCLKFETRTKLEARSPSSSKSCSTE